MKHAMEESYHGGVICLFCGKVNLLPTEVERRRFADPAGLGFRASIVRCDLCGKEALYLFEEVVDFQEVEVMQASETALSAHSEPKWSAG